MVHTGSHQSEIRRESVEALDWMEQHGEQTNLPIEDGRMGQKEKRGSEVEIKDLQSLFEGQRLKVAHD